MQRHMAEAEFGSNCRTRPWRVGNRTHALIYDRAKIQRLFWGTRFWRWCVRCSARSRQRKALSTLDDRLLEDIGVTRQQANAEAAKPFWK